MVSGDSSADSETEFVYDPLDSKPRTFRLIKLLPSTKPFFPFWREALRVEIVEQSLEEAAIFDTLSYTWGNVGRSLPDRPVIVETPRGRRILKIYASLELALLGLEKSGTADRPLFVDQICINQENNDEKASQVKLMGDIYAGCGRVIVWLGPGTRRSDEYFRFVSDICCEGVLSRVMGPNASHFPKVFKAVMDPSIEVSGVEREDRDDLLRLMRRYGHRFPLHGNSDVLGRMWFNRLWTIQEICLASNAVFTCGSHTLCFDCFRAGLLYYTIWNKRKLLHVNGTRMSLYDLVLLYNVNEEDDKVGAKLPEDRIYGLIGLALDNEMRRITKVKYDGVRNVYIRFAGLAVNQNLDVLMFSQNTTKSETSLPSWVPDWSAARLRIPYGYSDLNTPAFSAGGNIIEQPVIVNVEKGSMTVQGYLVDSVCRRGTQSIKKEMGDNTIEGIDYLSLTRFTDEINEFLGQAKDTKGPPFQDASIQHLYDATAVNLVDGGLSSKQFPAVFDPATAKIELEKVHRNAYHYGRVQINTELQTQSFSLARIIRTIGIVPWYWVPASEVDVLRLCATDPLRAAQRWLEGALDFTMDMISILGSSTAVQLTAWFVRVRQRFRRSINLTPSNPAVFERVGLDPGLLQTPQWDHYIRNLYKASGRKLFLTPRGYLGLGPENMREGDVVVVLVGSSVPHVLRPLSTTGPPDLNSFSSLKQSPTTYETLPLNADASWTYVGEAYCENIMDGEIMRERPEESMLFRIL